MITRLHSTVADTTSHSTVIVFYHLKGS